MTQLIIDGIYLPETSRDKYSCYPAPLTRTVEMVSGRVVQEVRGKVYKIHYSYDYMGNELLRSLLSVLRSNTPFSVTYLSDESDELKSSMFVAESVSNPTYAFSKTGKPYWHNVKFVLREVKPHD